MKKVNPFVFTPILLGLLFFNCGQKAGKVSKDLLKQKLEERLNYRNQIIKDYTCELAAIRMSESPRGEMKSEMTFILYKKMPDKTKADFVKGSRNGEKISKEDFENFGRGRPGSSRDEQPRHMPEDERRPGIDRRGDILTTNWLSDFHFANVIPANAGISLY